MLTNYLNYITEAAVWTLLFGITFSNSLTEAMVWTIIGIFFIKKILSKDYSLPSSCVNIPIYVLCAIVFVTFLRSAYFSESIRGFFKILKFALLYFSLIDFFSADIGRIRRAFWVLMSVAFLTFINGMFQYAYGFDFLRHKGFIREDYLRRIMASFVHPNDLGAYIIFVLPLTFCFFSTGLKRNQKAFLIINCLMGAYCLLKTSSRAAWLGFLVGIIIYFYYYRKEISVLVPLALMLVLVLSPHGFDRIKSLFALEQNTVWERVQLWKGTWNMVKVHPFLGFGANTFSRYFLEYKPAVYPDIRYTHNSYLQMWSEIGIFGLTAYLAVIFTILINVLRGMKKKLKKGFEGFLLLAVMSGYVAFLIQAGLDTNLYSLVLTTFFWIMCAYLVSLNKFLED